MAWRTPATLCELRLSMRTRSRALQNWISAGGGHDDVSISHCELGVRRGPDSMLLRKTQRVLLRSAPHTHFLETVHARKGF